MKAIENNKKPKKRKRKVSGKAKRIGAPKKLEIDKKIRINRTVDAVTLILLSKYKDYGFKSQSAMIDSAIMQVTKQYQLIKKVK